MSASASVFLLALIITYFLTPPLRRLMVHLEIYEPCQVERRIHIRPIPSLGGMAIFGGFLGALYFLGGSLLFEVHGLLLGGLVILIVGVVDDLVELSPPLKFVGQLLAAVILVFSGIRIEFVTNPFGGMFYLGSLTVPLTLLWVTGITNAVNFIDGLDGQAAGVAAIASFTLMAVAVQEGQMEMIILTAAVSGASLGFLPHNFNPARIFMGDTGSMFLGFILAGIAVRGALKGPAAMTLVGPILALGVPIFDGLCAVIRRWQHGRSIFSADKGHFHHRLLDLGLNHRQAVLTVYLLSFILGITAVFLNSQDQLTGFLVLLAVAFCLFVVARQIGVIEFISPKEKRSKLGGSL